MPTGYTSTLYNGEQSFRDYLPGCARAFGACVQLRDCPGGPAPEELPLDSYGEQKVAEWRAKLAQYEAWTVEEAQEASDADYAARQQAYTDYLAKTAGICERYTKMLTEIKAWEPPTIDHQELKRFMREQIETCWSETQVGEWYQRPVGCPGANGAKYKDEMIASAKKELAYYERKLEQEKARHAMRNSWLKALYASMPPKETT